MRFVTAITVGNRLGVSAVALGLVLLCGSGEAAAQPSPAEAVETTGAVSEVTPAASVDDVAIELHPPTRPVTVGDPARVRIQLHIPEGITFGGVSDANIGHLQLVDYQPRSTPDPEGGERVTLELTYRAYRPGAHTVEGMRLSFRLADGTEAERELPPFEVPVQSLVANEVDPQLRSEKGGVAARYRDYTLAWVLGIGAALLVFGAVGFLIARNRPRPVKVVPPPPPRPAHEVALEKLNAISRDRLIENGQAMEFSIRLSEAVREYLGRRYGFQGLDMTTSEILQRMTGVTLPPAVPPALVEQLLRDCDMVKFAKHAPHEKSEQQALSDAFSLVRETMVTVAPDTSEDTGEEPAGDDVDVPAAGESADRVGQAPETAEAEDGGAATDARGSLPDASGEAAGDARRERILKRPRDGRDEDRWAPPAWPDRSSSSSGDLAARSRPGPATDEPKSAATAPAGQVPGDATDFDSSVGGRARRGPLERSRALRGERSESRGGASPALPVGGGGTPPEPTQPAWVPPGRRQQPVRKRPTPLSSDPFYDGLEEIELEALADPVELWSEDERVTDGGSVREYLPDDSAELIPEGPDPSRSWVEAPRFHLDELDLKPVGGEDSPTNGRAAVGAGERRVDRADFGASAPELGRSAAPPHGAHAVAPGPDDDDEGADTEPTLPRRVARPESEGSADADEREATAASRREPT